MCVCHYLAECFPICCEGLHEAGSLKEVSQGVDEVQGGQALRMVGQKDSRLAGTHMPKQLYGKTHEGEYSLEKAISLNLPLCCVVLARVHR